MADAYNGIATVAQEEIIEELRNLLVEGEFVSRWGLVETYHRAGQLILENELPIEETAKAVGKSKRLVYAWCAFVKKYPSLDDIEGGKAVSWTRLYKKLLPAHKEKPVLEDRIEKFLEKYNPALTAKEKEMVHDALIEWEENG